MSQLKEKVMAYQSHLETTSMDNLKSEPKSENNNKNITFKEVKVLEETKPENDEELNVLDKRIGRLLRRQDKRYGNFKTKKSNPKSNVGKEDKKEKKSKDQEIICYECKKPGDIKYECPILIKKM